MNAEVFEAVVIYMYGISGLVGLAAYLPQIWKLFKYPAGRMGLSVTTWGLWSGIGVFPFLYAVFVVGNLEMIVITGGNAFFQFAMLGLAIHGLIIAASETEL